MKKITALLLFAIGWGLGFGALSLGSHLLCDRFSPSDIYVTPSINKRWMTDPLDYPKEIFNQPYAYLGKGSQCTVFASEDERYVIKFFRKKRLTPPLFWGGPTFMQKIHEEAQTEKQKELWALFSSCHLAFTELKKECGLLYLHLNKTKTLDNLLIIDKLKRPHLVDLNEVCFCIQKRAEPLMQRLATADVEKTLEAVATLLKRRFNKGIDDHDPVLQKNAGLIGDEAVFMDIGSFYPNPKARENQYESACAMTRKLGTWLDQKHEGNSTKLDNILKRMF